VSSSKVITRAAFKQQLLASVRCLRVMALASAACIPLPPAVAQETFANLSARAEAARDANQLDGAIGLYRRALKLKPSWSDGWWVLGTIYYDRNQYSEAVASFRRLLETDPKNGTAYSMLGLCEFELGQDEASLRNIQTGLGFGLLKDEGLRKVVLYHEGILLLRQNHFGSAQSALSLLASYSVRDDELALALGMAVLSIPPRNLPQESTQRAIVLWAGRAEILGTQKEMDKGEKIYASLVAQAPEFPNLHYAYGRYLLSEHQPEKAVAEFQTEIRNNPNHVRSYLYIAATRYRLDSADGVKYAAEAVRLDPSLPFGHYMLGLLYADTREYEKAISELEMAAQQMSQRADIYYALGNAYARVGRQQDAARARERFRQLSTENAAQDKPNVYGDNPSVRLDVEAVPDTKHTMNHGSENEHP
jgi:tetratricopeptide (TPR) repeat protein